MNQFPKMIYRGGADLRDRRIVHDAEELQQAAEEGYFPHGTQAEAPETPEAPAPASDPAPVTPRRTRSPRAQAVKPARSRKPRG